MGASTLISTWCLTTNPHSSPLPILHMWLHPTNQHKCRGPRYLGAFWTMSFVNVVFASVTLSFPIPQAQFISDVPIVCRALLKEQPKKLSRMYDQRYGVVYLKIFL